MPDLPTPTNGTSSPDEPRRLVAEIHGHVQGVGFRYFTRTTARRLGVTGFVRNDPNGIVTVVAEGTAEALDALLDALHTGPDLAEVDEVIEAWSAPRGKFNGFTIEY